MIEVVKLDYSIESPEERKALVEKILEETPNPSPAYLEILSDYLVLCMEKEEKREKKILTENRMATVNKRECSFEGLVSQMENGEDGIYNLITENKNVLFTPKISITQEDLDTIPTLRQLRDAIEAWEAAAKKTTGKQAYIMKKAVIEMRRQQYLIKAAYKRPVQSMKLTRNSRSYIPLDDTSRLETDANGDRNLVIEGVSLMSSTVCSAILCNYSRLKQDSYDQFEGDLWYLIQSFEDICDKALEHFPIYQRIIEMKIDKRQNSEIQQALKEEFDTSYTVEYISSLWRNKIPKMIAHAAQEDFIEWQYKINGWHMKKCSKCGQMRPAHNLFFSKNKTSKDGWYSICKSCRNKKPPA